MGRLLIVDDELALAVVYRRALKEHECHIARDGAEALVRLTGAEHFDGVLCDYAMPRMNGAQLYDSLERLRPSLLPRIIFVTASVGNAAFDAFIARIPNRVLEKPCDVQVLRDAVAAVLHE